MRLFGRSEARTTPRSAVPTAGARLEGALECLMCGVDLLRRSAGTRPIEAAQSDSPAR